MGDARRRDGLDELDADLAADAFEQSPAAAEHHRRDREREFVDEFTLAISPVMFGGGRRLFEGISREVGVELVETIASPRVTHVRYAVRTP